MATQVLRDAAGSRRWIAAGRELQRLQQLARLTPLPPLMAGAAPPASPLLIGVLLLRPVGTVEVHLLDQRPYARRREVDASRQQARQ